MFISFSLVLLHASVGAIIYLLSALVVLFHYIRYFHVVLLNRKHLINPYTRDFKQEIGISTFCYSLMAMAICVLIISYGLQIAFYPLFLERSFYLVCFLTIVFLLIGVVRIKNVVIRDVCFNGFLSIVIAGIPYISCYIMMHYSGWFGP